VIKENPDSKALPGDTPEPVRRLLSRCLEKDPKRRLHDAADARLEIEDAMSSPGQSASTAQADGSSHVRRRETVAWTAAAILSIATAILAILAFDSTLFWQPAPAPAIRTSLVHRGTAIVGAPQISPDGRRVVYVARDPDGAWSLWVRELDAAEPRRLAATAEFDSGHQPFWSPDSRSIGYFAPQALMRVAASGGSAQKLADIGYPQRRHVVVERRHPLFARRQRRPLQHPRGWRLANGGNDASQGGRLGAFLAIVSSRWAPVPVHGQAAEPPVRRQ
jgi:hypothetical protein